MLRIKIKQAIKIMQRLFKETQNEKILIEIENLKNYDNIDEWCEMLHRYIEDNKIIYLLCDCDLDGDLSSSMFYVYVKTINPSINIQPFFHHKNPKAHGLGDEDIFTHQSTDMQTVTVIESVTTYPVWT